jgi:hypothetical protein
MTELWDSKGSKSKLRCMGMILEVAGTWGGSAMFKEEKGWAFREDFLIVWVRNCGKMSSAFFPSGFHQPCLNFFSTES